MDCKISTRTISINKTRTQKTNMPGFVLYFLCVLGTLMSFGLSEYRRRKPIKEIEKLVRDYQDLEYDKRKMEKNPQEKLQSSKLKILNESKS